MTRVTDLSDARALSFLPLGSRPRPAGVLVAEGAFVHVATPRTAVLRSTKASTLIRPLTRTMKESDYQALYRLFHAFTSCGKPGTHCVRGDNEVALATEDRACFSSDGRSLFLCERCLKFWQECRRVHDRSLWDTAVFLRRSRSDRQGEG